MIKKSGMIKIKQFNPNIDIAKLGRGVMAGTISGAIHGPVSWLMVNIGMNLVLGHLGSWFDYFLTETWMLRSIAGYIWSGAIFGLIFGLIFVAIYNKLPGKTSTTKLLSISIIHWLFMPPGLLTLVNLYLQEGVEGLHMFLSWYLQPSAFFLFSSILWGWLWMHFFASESRSASAGIGVKDMRSKPFQLGFAVMMGWVTLMVPYFVIQASILPGGGELFWGYAFLGLSFIGSGVVLKVKEWFNTIGTTLLQIGFIVTIIWLITLIQRKGYLDLVLLNPYFGWAHTYFRNIPEMLFQFLYLVPFLVVFLYIPFLELFKFVSKSTRAHSWRSNNKDRWKRFVEWCRKPSIIKIRGFNLNPIIAVISVLVVMDVLFVSNAPILLGPLINISEINTPTNMDLAVLLPSKIIGQQLDSGSIETENLYVVCGHFLSAEVAPEDIEKIKYNVEHTRARYEGVVIHLFKASWWDTETILYILSHVGTDDGIRLDVDWYGGALSAFGWGDRVTLTNGDRSAFFWRSGEWVFGVDAENFKIRNDAVRDLIQHLENL
jgi:hypothetical protein